MEEFKDLGQDNSFCHTSKVKPGSYSEAVKTTSNNRKTVASKRATRQGTKATQVNVFLPVDHTVLPHVLAGSHEVILHLFYL